MSHLCWRRVCAVSWRSWQPWNNEWAVIIPALMNSSRLRAPRTTDNVISHFDTFSYNYAAKFAHSLLLPAFFLSTAGFRRVQTVRSNRTITFWQAFSSWFFWTFSLHHCPPLHQQKGNGGGCDWWLPTNTNSYGTESKHTTLRNNS